MKLKFISIESNSVTICVDNIDSTIVFKIIVLEKTVYKSNTIIYSCVKPSSLCLKK